MREKHGFKLKRKEDVKRRREDAERFQAMPQALNETLMPQQVPAAQVSPLLPPAVR